MKYIVLTACVILIHCFSLQATTEDKVLEFVHSQQCSGILKRSNDFLYVDIDDGIIHLIAPIIQEEGFSEPPYFGEELVGAHISVAFPSEIYGINEIVECDSEVHFIPTGCEIVPLNQPNSYLPNVEELYLIVVAAPELDRIRERIGLSKSRYPFHITVGVK